MNRLAGLMSKEIRGKILRVLQVNFPYGVGDQLLSDVLQDAQFNVSPQQVQGHLIYLEEKGYVTQEKNEVRYLGLARMIIKLTAHGIDLLDGNIESDPGVKLP